MHGIVDHGKIGTIEKSLDGRKVKDALQKVDVNLGGIDNLDGDLLGAISPSDGGAADGGDVDGVCCSDNSFATLALTLQTTGSVENISSFITFSIKSLFF